MVEDRIENLLNYFGGEADEEPIIYNSRVNLAIATAFKECINLVFDKCKEEKLLSGRFVRSFKKEQVKLKEICDEFDITYNAAFFIYAKEYNDDEFQAKLKEVNNRIEEKKASLSVARIQEILLKKGYFSDEKILSEMIKNAQEVLKSYPQVDQEDYPAAEMLTKLKDICDNFKKSIKEELEISEACSEK